MGQGQPMNEADGEKIMHVALPVGDHSVLMGNDSLPSFGTQRKWETIYLYLSMQKVKKKRRDFLMVLSAGGQVTMPMEKTFWDAYFGMFADKFGINWMVNYDYNKPAK